MQKTDSVPAPRVPDHYWPDARSKSGVTSWEKPALPKTAFEAREGVTGDERVLWRSFRSLDAVRLKVGNILRGQRTGEELHDEDFRLVFAVLKYHPDSAAKIGVGVRSIRVPHPSHLLYVPCGLN